MQIINRKKTLVSLSLSYIHTAHTHTHAEHANLMNQLVSLLHQMRKGNKLQEEFVRHLSISHSDYLNVVYAEVHEGGFEQ